MLDLPEEVLNAEMLDDFSTMKVLYICFHAFLVKRKPQDNLNATSHPQWLNLNRPSGKESVRYI